MSVQYNRAPCPGRVFEDLGNGFMIGCAWGTVFYFLKGKLLELTRRHVECSKTIKILRWLLSLTQQSSIPGRQLWVVGRHFRNHGVPVNTFPLERRSV